jgi:hypothetical protein
MLLSGTGPITSAVSALPQGTKHLVRISIQIKVHCSIAQNACIIVYGANNHTVEPISSKNLSMPNPLMEFDL